MLEFKQESIFDVKIKIYVYFIQVNEIHLCLNSLYLCSEHLHFSKANSFGDSAAEEYLFWRIAFER